MKRRSFLLMFGIILSIIFTGLFNLGTNHDSAFAEEKVSTKIKHRPLEYYIPENRIRLEASVEDESGVTLVRCYFRASGQEDFVFVPMGEKEKGIYEAILPAPGSQIVSLEYLFLVVAGQNRVIRSQAFTVNKKDQKEVPSWQMVEKTDSIRVSTEIIQTADVAGYYSDNITLDLVESSLRFGYIVALYQTTQIAAAGGASGAAATAAGGGTVTATAGISTGVLVAAGAGAAVVVGGAAAAGGGGGGGGGSSSGGSSSGPTMLGSSCSQFCSQWPTYMPGASCSCTDANTANAYSNTRISAKCPANGWGVTAKGWTTGNWSFNYFAPGYSTTMCTWSGNNTAFNNCIPSMANTMANYCATP